MPIDVKICGLKTKEEINIINQFPIAYAGFIFAPSKRQVSIDQARALIQSMRKDIQKVGVFVDSPIEEVLRAVNVCKLDVIQLHGKETVDYIQKIPCRVWKTIQVEDTSSFEGVQNYLGTVEGLLLDTYHKDMHGGTGVEFDWSCIPFTLFKQSKMILAGGLRPENIHEAINKVQPNVIDVNSGIEVQGYKTYGRIKKLFEELKI
ncbi:phosphoribosylanthranilate isomerase [Vallitaleaceae bacterium 9-2]